MQALRPRVVGHALMSSIVLMQRHGFQRMDGIVSLIFVDIRWFLRFHVLWEGSTMTSWLSHTLFIMKDLILIRKLHSFQFFLAHTIILDTEIDTRSRPYIWPWYIRYYHLPFTITISIIYQYLIKSSGNFVFLSLGVLFTKVIWLIHRWSKVLSVIAQQILCIQNAIRVRGSRCLSKNRWHKTPRWAQKPVINGVKWDPLL